MVAPPVEGALAPKPEPLRELPGTRKKEKTWREEVNERVRSRRKKRVSETGLPLFDGIGDLPEPVTGSSQAEPATPRAEEPPRLEDARLEGALEEPVADLPLHAREVPPPSLRTRDDSSSAAPEREPGMDVGDEPASPPDDEWRLELQPPTPEHRPLERPAVWVERLKAGAVDFVLWAALSGVVAYFAGRAARVPVLGLRPAWPWLGSYLVFLGLAYATYFTGTTGQTLGKMMLGLRVVDTAGQPPGYVRAFLRAALGGLGVMAAGLGLVPMAFDPALRALHDRACSTRVIRS